MRTIKFRIWNNIGKRMLYDSGLEVKGTKIISKFCMQFTGLKDKNGKEIFEGDIVIIPKHSYSYEEFDGEEIIKTREETKCVVIFSNGRYWLKAHKFTIVDICKRLGHDYNTFLSSYASADIFRDEDRVEIKNILGDLINGN